MHGTGTARRTGWAGALLLAAHLVAGILAPLAHADEILDRSPDHAEAGGTHHGGHSDACVVCRHADPRFAGAGRADPLVAAAPAARQAARERDVNPPRSVPTAVSARAPPPPLAAG
jgi:hypothetical protein